MVHYPQNIFWPCPDIIFYALYIVLAGEISQSECSHRVKLCGLLRVRFMLRLDVILLGFFGLSVCLFIICWFCCTYMFRVSARTLWIFLRTHLQTHNRGQKWPIKELSETHFSSAAAVPLTLKLLLLQSWHFYHAEDLTRAAEQWVLSNLSMALGKGTLTCVSSTPAFQ